MARPTERAIKRKPMAVIFLTTKRQDVPEVPPAGREFEWFDTAPNRKAFFKQVHEFNVEDTKEHDDMAYLTIEIVDTESMKIGRAEVAPVTDETQQWLKDIESDITKAYVPAKAPDSKDGEKKVVRARKKSSAAAAVKKDEGADKGKAARLKERLAAKKEAEAPKAPAKKAAAKKTAPAKKAVSRPRKTSAAEEERVDNKVIDMKVDLALEAEADNADANV